MIKFNVLIHKETGTIIQYADWLRFLKERTIYIWRENCSQGEWRYLPKEMLFSEDFEIVYEQDFTTAELIQLYGLSGELRMRCSDLINERYELQRKYKYGFK